MIAGILSFMLWPGQADWHQTGGVLNAFFGENTFAQVAARFMFMLTITGVVGGMVASMVSITTPLTFSTGGTNLVIQDMLDSIIPKMLPFVFTLGIYNLVQKKVNTNVLLIGIVLFGMVMGALGIL